MKKRRLSGVTLPELVIVMSIVSLIAVATMTLFLRATSVYARTDAHSHAQLDQILAVKRMEREMREAMFISVTGLDSEIVSSRPNPQKWVEISLPMKESDGHNKLVQGADGILGLERDPARDTVYFQGMKEYPNPGDKSHWNAIPIPLSADADDPKYDTVFKALSSTKVGTGDSAIYPLGYYPEAEVIIEPPKEHSEQIPRVLFEYWPVDPTDPTRPCVNSQLIMITLTMPIKSSTLAGAITEEHKVKTQFCLRNLSTSQ